MRERRALARTAGLIGSLTFLSRIAGYARDVIIAFFFGASGATDAFYVAFRIPNLLRRLFAEGSLTISFIPVFTEYLEKGDKAEAKRVSDAVFTALIVVLGVITVLGVLFSPVIIKIFASGFKEEYFNLAVGMNRVMFPYILLVSVVALSMGVLNSLRHFFAPAISPLLLNLGIIATVLVLHSFFALPIYTVALGVIVGGVLQVLFQVPFLRMKGFLFSFRSNLSHPAVKRIGLLMAPQLFGLGVYNVNIIISTQYASHLPMGTVSYLYYSERLIEFPLGIIAVSIATALLPSLSGSAARGESGVFRRDYARALMLMLFAMIPALVGLIVLRVPICNLLYQHGEFSYLDTVYTSQSLLGYALGLWAIGGVRITAPTFYALKDTKTPVIAAFFSLLVNAALGYFLAFSLDLRHFGLALATSVSAIFQFLILFFEINRRMGRVHIRSILPSLVKVIAASLVMGAVALALSRFGHWEGSGFGARKIAVLVGSVSAAGALYFVICRLLGVAEAREVMDIVLKRPRAAASKGD